MIAVSSNGASFTKLANYLVRERTDGLTRVAWATTRNLPTEDVQLAAYFMHATAAENVRVEKPVYHLAVSFHPEDPVTQPMMERVADRLLSELNLTAHQAVIVAHGDRSHPHMHLMINRIHPDSYRAWDRWMDWTITQRVLREEELALGLRQTRGRLHAPEGQSLAPERSVVTAGEYRQAVRGGAEPLVERVRAYATELRATRSWDALHALLQADGLRIERKGLGLVITDGDHQVKASRVHRDLSFARIEQRLGPFRRITQEVALDRPHATPAVPNERVAAAANLARQAEYHHRLNRIAETAARLHRDAHNRAQHLEWRYRDAAAARQVFCARLDRMYRDPEAARVEFERVSLTTSIETAAKAMREHPETFGPLQHTTVKKYLGLVRVKNYSQAIHHAPAAAAAGAHAQGMTQQLQQMMDRFTGPRTLGTEASYGRALTHAHAHERHTWRRLRQMRILTRDVGAIDCALARTISVLTPPELRELAIAITAPQHAIAMKTVEVTRQIALSRERGLHL